MKTNAMRMAQQGCLGLQGFRGALQRLSMTLLLTMLTVTTAWADASGSCGDNLTWVFTESDGKLTISGEGDMYNYNSANTVPWYNYREQIKKVILPKGLTCIGKYAFYGVLKLREISIPASVSKIANYAFCRVGTKRTGGCTFTVAKGSKLTTIYEHAFNGYRGDIDLLECTDLTDIQRYTFQNYEHGTLLLPVNISTIYRDAFKGAKSLNLHVYLDCRNSVLYVNDKYKAVNLKTGHKRVYIQNYLSIKDNSSNRVDFAHVSFDDIAISFDENDETYVISKKQGLIDLGAKLAKKLQSIRLEDHKVKLAADLDFTNMPLDCEITSNQRGNFMPIDIYSASINFSFDGQGHTIKGLKFSGEGNVGLFSSIGKYAIVKNVTLIAPSFSGTNSIGGIASNNNGGSITNCSVIAPSISGDSHLGGIAGNNNGGSITHCSVIDPSISGTGSFIGCVIGGGNIPQRCDFDVSTGLDIYGEEVDVPFLDARLADNRPLLHLNLDYGITSTKAITIRNYTMGELYDRIWLYANRAGYDLVNYKSEEVTIEENWFEMPQKNVSVTAVWEPMKEINFKGSLFGGVNWSTFYCGDAGYRINEEEKACAYTATVDDDMITLYKLGKVIPKGTAVIIASENDDISMTRDDVSAAEYKVKNDLHGVDLATPRTTLTANDAQTLFMLSNKNDHFGFHKFGGANVPARKAFFSVSSSEKARSFGMVFDEGTPTGVGHTEITEGLARRPAGESQSTEMADAIYDLQGRRIEKPKKGLYIVNGKKVVIK